MAANGAGANGKRVEIVQPNTPEQVCEYLKDLQGRSAVHAGGTDLLVQMRTGKIKPDYIIDLSKVGELKQAKRLEDGKLWLGAMVSLNTASLIFIALIVLRHHPGNPYIFYFLVFLLSS